MTDESSAEVNKKVKSNADVVIEQGIAEERFPQIAPDYESAILVHDVVRKPVIQRPPVIIDMDDPAIREAAEARAREAIKQQEINKAGGYGEQMGRKLSWWINTQEGQERFQEIQSLLIEADKRGDSGIGRMTTTQKERMHRTGTFFVDFGDKENFQDSATGKRIREGLKRIWQDQKDNDGSSFSDKTALLEQQLREMKLADIYDKANKNGHDIMGIPKAIDGKQHDEIAGMRKMEALEDGFRRGWRNVIDEEKKKKNSVK